MKHNKKPYQARPLLNSIRYWQLVASGSVAPRRKLAYYINKLKFYSQDDIDYLEAVAKTSMVKVKRQ